MRLFRTTTSFARLLRSLICRRSIVNSRPIIPGRPSIDVGEVLQVMEQVAMEGMTMMVATHEMGFALRVANRVMFVDRGRLVEVGSPREIFEQSARRAYETFLGEDIVGDPGQRRA
jgi:ABC-type histidine transport system ATPase subunit